MMIGMTQVVLATLALLLCVSGMSDEKRLTKHLLKNYENVGLSGRPVYNSTSSMEVTIGFYLVQIQNFDQFKQILTLTGISKLMWTDVLLRWEPDDFGEVQTVTVPPERVWTPDVVMFNSISEPRLVHPGNCWVTSDGEVTWVQEYQWDILCETYEEDMKPTCELRFGSWTLPKDRLTLRKSLPRLNANYYVQNHVYELDKTKAEEHEKEYPFRQGEYYNDVTYSFTLKRRPPKVEEKVEDNGSSTVQFHLGAALITLLLAMFIH